MKFLAVLLLLATSLGSTSIYAQTHSDEDFPEGALLILEGKDAVSRKDCFLFVMDVGFTGPEERPDQWYAEVLTSYSHGHDAPDAIIIGLHPNRTGVLWGKGHNQKDELAVFLDPHDLDLNNIKSFNFRWWHRNHFDTFRCQNMKPHEHH